METVKRHTRAAYGCLVAGQSPWAQAYRLYARSVCDTKAPLWYAACGAIWVLYAFDLPNCAKSATKSQPTNPPHGNRCFTAWAIFPVESIIECCLVIVAAENVDDGPDQTADVGSRSAGSLFPRRTFSMSRVRIVIVVLIIVVNLFPKLVHLSRFPVFLLWCLLP